MSVMELEGDSSAENMSYLLPQAMCEHREAGECPCTTREGAVWLALPSGSCFVLALKVHFLLRCVLGKSGRGGAHQALGFVSEAI